MASSFESHQRLDRRADRGRANGRLHVAANARWLEKGLSAFFHLTNGITALGLAVALGPRTRGGSAPSASSRRGRLHRRDRDRAYRALGGGRNLGPSALAGLAFLAAFSIALWRSGSRSDRPIAEAAAA